MKKCNRLISHLAFPINYSIISILNRPTTLTDLDIQGQYGILNDYRCLLLPSIIFVARRHNNKGTHTISKYIEKVPGTKG